MSPTEFPPFLLFFWAAALVPFLRGLLRAALLLLVPVEFLELPLLSCRSCITRNSLHNRCRER